MCGASPQIQGHSVKADMSKIRELIGVCPQTNVCWDLLTVEDHLRLFAVIRRMEPGDADAQIDEVGTGILWCTAQCGTLIYNI